MKKKKEREIDSTLIITCDRSLQLRLKLMASFINATPRHTDVVELGSVIGLLATLMAWLGTKLAKILLIATLMDVNGWMLMHSVCHSAT